MRNQTILNLKTQRSWVIREKPRHVMAVKMAEGLTSNAHPVRIVAVRIALIILDILVLDDTHGLPCVSLSYAGSGGERGFGRKLKATVSQVFTLPQEDDRRVSVAHEPGGRRMARFIPGRRLAWVVSRYNEQEKLFYLVNLKLNSMPIDPSIIGTIAGGSNVIETGINAILQDKTNKAQRRYATYMYDRQRADALADWQRQNEYNSPQSIMGRYKAAGLNPNLIYDQQTQAPSVRSSAPQSYHPEAPQLNLSSGIMGYYQTMLAQTQIETMKTAQQVNAARERQLAADTLLKGWNAGLIKQKTAAAAFELGFQKSVVGVRSDTMSANMDVLKAKKDQIVTQTMYQMHEDIRREMLSKATFQEKMQHVALMIAQESATRAGEGLTHDMREKVTTEINNLIKDGTIKEQEIMKKSGELDWQVLEHVMKAMPHIWMPLK